jgi:hypothetical protein
LFTQIFLCMNLCYKLSHFQAHWEKWHCTHIVSPVCLFTVHVGGGSSPLSCGVFLPLPLSQAFLLLITGRCCCSCQLPCLFTVHVGSGSPLLSCGVFLSPHSHKLSCSWLLGVSPHSRQRLSGQASLCIYSPRKDFLPPIFGAQCTPPSFPHVFIALIAYYSVSLFSPGGGWSVQGAMLIWPRVVCGSTVYHLTHLVCVFPSHLGTGNWWPGGPPGFFF